MGSVGAFGRDVHSQPGFLAQLELPAQLPRRALAGSVFVGSGDSLAACMLAESHSGGVARAMDPQEFCEAGPLAGSSTAYVVSVSGRTAAGVRAARAAKRSVAVTGCPSSRLARAAGGVVALRARQPELAAGSVAFLESALACVSMVAGSRMPDAAGIFAAAQEGAAGVQLPRRVYFLGNYMTYPLAMYGAAKLYEVLGHDAVHARTEQFFHMELFSARRGDAAVLFEPRNERGRAAASALGDAGMEVVWPEVPAGGVRQLVHCAFFSQLLALYGAQRRGMAECHFVTAGAARGASDRIIY